MHRLILSTLGLLVVLFPPMSSARQVDPPTSLTPDGGDSGRTRSPEPGYLGLITSDRQQGGRGVRVMHVDRGSPADDAGIREGDLIVGIGDRPIAFTADMRAALRGAVPGTKLVFKVDRAGSTKEREVTLGQRPAKTPHELPFGPIPEDLPPPPGIAASGSVPPPAEPPIERDPALRPVPSDVPPPPRADPDAPAHATAYLGVRTVPVTERDRWQLELPLRMGAKVTAISVGSPADGARIPLFAVIVAVNGKAVVSPTDLARRIAAHSAGEEVELSYYFRGEPTRRRVVLGSATDVAAVAVTEPPAEPAPPIAASAADAKRIAELEREVADLKARLVRLEEALSRSSPRQLPAPKPSAPADQPKE
jgi:predicted metalloprotease with PDZ domain